MLPPPARENARLLDDELTRVSHIVRETLNLYREDSRPSLVRPREVVEEVLRAQHPSLKGLAVEARCLLDEAVEIHRAELFQLLSNLVVNAGEACSDGGSLRIHVRASRDWRRPERHGLRIVVADSGCGIADQDRRQLVEPFFTTKQQKGAGLGLSVVQWIAAKYGGSLRIRSTTRPGRSGTCVSVFLALASAPRPQPQPIRAAGRSQAS